MRPKLAVIKVSGCHLVLVICVGDALLAKQGPQALVKAHPAVVPASMPGADGRTICARRHVTTDPPPLWH